MPVDRVGAVQLGLLLLVLPTQYFISQWFTTSEHQRTFAIKNLLSDAVGFKNRYFSWKSWQKWCVDVLQGSFQFFKGKPEYTGQLDENGESPAVEVLNYKDPKGYFATSPEPRSNRPSKVKYRVGQVIKHKIWGYRGIIIGWDPVAKAPSDWIRRNHPPDKPNWQEMPNYSIIVDTRDRLVPQVTYVPEENIEIITNVKIIHPQTDNYFEGFDGAQYLPRPWLRALYPFD